MAAAAAIVVLVTVVISLLEPRERLQASWFQVAALVLFLGIGLAGYLLRRPWLAITGAALLYVAGAAMITSTLLFLSYLPQDLAPFPYLFSPGALLASGLLLWAINGAGGVPRKAVWASWVLGVLLSVELLGTIIVGIGMMLAWDDEISVQPWYIRYVAALALAITGAFWPARKEPAEQLAPHSA